MPSCSAAVTVLSGHSSNEHIASPSTSLNERPADCSAFAPASDRKENRLRVVRFSYRVWPCPVMPILLVTLRSYDVLGLEGCDFAVRQAAPSGEYLVVRGARVFSGPVDLARRIAQLRNRSRHAHRPKLLIDNRRDGRPCEINWT